MPDVTANRPGQRCPPDRLDFAGCRQNGDGGSYARVDDLHLFWQSLVAGRIVGAELVETMTMPRHDVPAEGLRYGLGCWTPAFAGVSKN